MSSSSRRAVLTGIGAINAIGQDAASYWESLQQGRSGIRRIELFDASGLPVQIAAEVPDFQAKNYLTKTHRKNLRVMARTIQLAVAAAQLALDEGKVDTQALDPTRFGVAFGAGLIATELIELGEASQVCVNSGQKRASFEEWGDEAIPKINPLWMLKYLPNMLACHVSIIHNAQGPNNSITESDVASLLALGESYRILMREGADFFLVGGAESKLNPLSMARQCLFEPLSRDQKDPSKACRPFDRDRNGMVLGEGGTVLVLEDLEHAKKRGARIYAEMVGLGASFDRERNGKGLARAIRAALTEAGIGPEEIDHINAHGLGTVEGDAWEAQGIQEVFGNCSAPVPVLAAKSYIGNLGAGGGVSELAASILALENGIVPCTLNYENPDPACPVSVIAKEARPVEKPYVLKLSFTNMGQCAAVVIKKYND